MKWIKMMSIIGTGLLIILIFSACNGQKVDELTENNQKEEEVVNDTSEFVNNEESKVDENEIFLREVEQEVNTLQLNTYLTSMLSTMIIIDDLDFHGLEQQAIELEDHMQDLQQSVNRTLNIMNKTMWVPELEETSQTLKGNIRDLQDALNENDQHAAISAIEDAHRTEHQLDQQFYSYLYDAEAKAKSYSWDQLNETLANLEVVLIDASMITANHIIEKIDFHGWEYMADDIESRAQDLLQQSGHTLKIIQGTTWVPELEDNIYKLESDIESLLDALIANDQQAAREAIQAAHSTEHNIELTYDSYLQKKQSIPTYDLTKEELSERINLLGNLAQISQMTTANYVIEHANFHDIAHDLNDGSANTQDISGTIDKLIPIIQSTTWSSELEEVAENLNKEFTSLQNALLSENIEESAIIADTIHALQHEQETAYYQTMEKAANNTFSASTSEPSREEESNSDDSIQTDAQVLEVIQGDSDEYDVTINKEGMLSTGKINLKIINKGNMPHGVWSTGLQVNEVVAGDDEMIVTIEADEPGTYTLMCAFPACGSSEEHASMAVTIEIH